MEDTPGTSTSEVMDIHKHKETSRLLCRIDRKVQHHLEFLNSIGSVDVKKTDVNLQIAAKLTGLTPLALDKIQKLDTPVTSIETVDRSVVLVSYSLYCLQLRQLPSTKRLYLNLQDKIPIYMDITSFRKMLVDMDFIWKRSYDGGLVIIENPKVYFERFRYLKKLIEYKDSPVYYVDENYMFHGGSINLEWVSAYNVSEFRTQGKIHAGYLGVLYAVSKEGINAVQYEYIDDINEDTFETWVVDTLIPMLHEPSVVIFNNAPHHCKLVNPQPTLNSLKIEIIEFLNANNVPYDIDMSKYELYCLSQKLAKVKKNCYLVDNILETKGHKVLRLPRHIENLTPTSYLNEYFKVQLNKEIPTKYLKDTMFREKLDQQFDLVDSDALSKCFNNINEEIERLYNRDVIMDQIYDEIVTKSIKTTDRYEDSEVPVSSDDDDDDA